MSKRPTDGYEPAAKKRGSERQLTRDDVSDEEEAEKQGTIETASEAVMKTRKVVRARRGTAAPPTTPACGVPSAKSNPFAGVSLLSGNGPANPIAPKESKGPDATNGNTEAPKQAVVQGAGSTVEPTQQPSKDALAQAHSTASVEAQDTGKTASQETVKNKATAESNPETSHSVEQTESPIMGTLTPHSLSAAQSNGSALDGPQPSGSFASFASNSAPFANVAASRPVFNFGTMPEAGASTNSDDGKSKPFSFGPLPTSTGFSFKPIGGGFPAVPGIFGAKPATTTENGSAEEVEQNDNIKPALAVLPPETETVTGEEDETQLWAGEGTLYEFTPPQSWRERGKGEMRINKGPDRPARFVLRQRGQHRLLMNANLWPEMKVTRMDGGKGATFPVVNAAKTGEETDAGEPKMQTFAFRVKNAAQMDAFIDAVNANRQPAS